MLTYSRLNDFFFPEEFFGANNQYFMGGTYTKKDISCHNFDLDSFYATNLFRMPKQISHIFPRIFKKTLYVCYYNDTYDFFYSW